MNHEDGGFDCPALRLARRPPSALEARPVRESVLEHATWEVAPAEADRANSSPTTPSAELAGWSDHDLEADRRASAEPLSYSPGDRTSTSPITWEDGLRARRTHTSSSTRPPST